MKQLDRILAEKLLKISDVRIRFVKKEDSKLKAVASITIDDCFVVHDIKVIEGADKLFVGVCNRCFAAAFVIEDQNQI